MVAEDLRPYIREGENLLNDQLDAIESRRISDRLPPYLRIMDECVSYFQTLGKHKRGNMKRLDEKYFASQSEDPSLRRELHLQDNSFSDWGSSGIDHFSSLRILDLSNNRMSTLKFDFLLDFSFWKYFILIGSTVECCLIPPPPYFDFSFCYTFCVENLSGCVPLFLLLVLRS